MSRTSELPRLAGDRLFITDGGMETTLIFHRGIDLPDFAAFDLLKDEAGVAALRDYYEPYVAVAREHGVGVVLDTPTWRASADWGARLGYRPPSWRPPTGGASSSQRRCARRPRTATSRSWSAARSVRAATATTRATRCPPTRPRTTTPRRSRPSPTRARTWSPPSR